MPHLGPRHIPVDPDAVDAVRLLMEAVVAELVDYVEHDENAAGDPYGQSQYIDEGISKMFCEVAEGDLDDVAEHEVEFIRNPIIYIDVEITEMLPGISNNSG